MPSLDYISTAPSSHRPGSPYTSFTKGAEGIETVDDPKVRIKSGNVEQTFSLLWHGHWALEPKVANVRPSPNRAQPRSAHSSD